MKKYLIVLILLFCSLNIFSQSESRLSNENELFINLSAFGIGMKFSSNENVWTIPYRLLNFYYIIDRRLGFQFSPLVGWVELKSFNDSLSDMLSNTYNFFNFKFNYYLFMDYVNDTIGYLMLGPYISTNYLNIDSITGFDLNKIIMNVGFNITMIKLAENTPFTFLNELDIGYRYTNYLENKHSIYFTLKCDPFIIVYFFAKLTEARYN